jgi:hypothetical protein
MALPRLIFVTGKGGTGKSTVAAALSIAISRRRPVTVADLDQRHSVAHMLGLTLNGVGTVNAGDNLDITALTPRAELEAFIQGIVPLKAVSRRMLRSRTFGYVTAALPGLEAFLMAERLRRFAGQAALEDRYAVIDAPASGSALELLSVASAVKRIAPRGTLNRLAETVEEFLTDPNRFGVMLTAWPEDLALRETVETAARLRNELGVRSIAAVLNGVTDALFSGPDLVKARTLGELSRLAQRRHDLAADSVGARRELTDAGLPVVELPMMFKAALGPDELIQLADILDGATRE